MSDVKRYDPINKDGTCGVCIEDADYGAYVEYADYAALEAELAKLRAVPVAWIAGCYRDAIEGRTDRIPLGVECSLVNLNWFDQIPLYTAPQPAAVQEGYVLVPVEPTPEMVSAAEEAHMPFGDMDIALRMAMLAAPAPVQHTDDAAVDRFAEAMKAKLAKSRAKGRGGRGGWEDKAQCSAEYLSELLRGHVDKGDPVDVANLCMMLSLRGEGIAAPAPVAEPASPWVAVTDDLQWAVDRWHAEVSQRPLVNVHRRSLDDTWRQIIRRLGGDDVLLCGPRHDDLVSGQPLPPAPEVV